MYSCQLINLKGWEDREWEAALSVIYNPALTPARPLFWALHREQTGIAVLPREPALSAVNTTQQCSPPGLGGCLWGGSPLFPQVKWEIQETEDGV